MKRILITVAIFLSAGISVGQMKAPLFVESATYLKPQPLPAFYQKYIEWVITSNQHSTPISAEVLFHREPSVAPAMKWISIPGRVKLQYAEQGNSSGTPYILLHGFPDSWHSYEQVMRHLPGYLHVYAVSQRGHGNSDRPENYDPKEFAADLNAMMEQLNIQHAVIVGHSMGATVAQRFAIDYPNRVAGLVLEGAIASFPKNQVVNDFVGTVTQLSDPIDRNFAREFQQSTLANNIDSTYFELLLDESMKIPARVWKGVMKGLLPIDYTAELRNFNGPVLLIWGEKDALSPRADQETFLKTLKYSSLIVYNGIGHSAHWEQPARFANDLVEFATKYKIDIYE